MLYFSIFYYNRFGVVNTLGQYFVTSSNFVFDISLQQYWLLYLFCFALLSGCAFVAGVVADNRIILIT